MRRLLRALKLVARRLFVQLPEPLRHLLGAFADAVVRATRDEATLISGHVAFSLFLALFPFAAALAAAAGFLGEVDAADETVARLLAAFPDEIARALTPILHDVMSQRQGDLLTLSILFMLYSAGSGVSALRLSLNRAYHLVEHRSLWLLLLVNAVVVIGGMLVLLLMSLAFFIVPLFWDSLVAPLLPDAADRALWNSLRILIATAALVASITVAHWWLPAAWLRPRHVLPGVLLTAAAWMALVGLFQLYLSEMANYSLTYGSLGGVAACLVFFYLAAFAFVLGGYFNEAWHERADLKAP